MEYKSIAYWSEKLNTFNWSTDRPRNWRCCKPGVKISAVCFIISLIMAVYVSVTDNGEFWISMFCLGGFCLFLGIITIFILWQTHLVLGILEDILPMSKLISEAKAIKKSMVVYGLCLGLSVIAIGVTVSYSFLFFSGCVFSITGLIFSVFFAFKIDGVLPKEFLYILRIKYLQNMGRLQPEVMKQLSIEEVSSQINAVSNNSLVEKRKSFFSGGVNPATGIPMINDAFDAAGNPFGCDFLQSNRISTFFDNSIDNISTGFNSASGLPMVNESFDINGDVLGTTSHFYNDHHHNHNSHSWDDRW